MPQATEGQQIILDDVYSGNTARSLEGLKEDWKSRWARYEELNGQVSMVADTVIRSQAAQKSAEARQMLLRERVDLNEMIARYNALAMGIRADRAEATWGVSILGEKLGLSWTPTLVDNLNGLGVIWFWIIGAALVTLISAFATAKSIWGNANVQSKGALDSLSDLINAIPETFKVLPPLVEKTTELIKVGAAVAAVGLVGWFAYKKWGGART